MKRPFLVIAVVCLLLFVVAGVVAGELIPHWLPSPRATTRGLARHGASLWSVLQNVSAVVGIVSFLIQVVQWGRGRRA